MASSQEPPLSALESLPFDMLALILTHLPTSDIYPTVLALAAANSRLHASIHPSALVPHPARVWFYHHAQTTFPQHKDRLVCYTCWRFRERAMFSETNGWGRRGTAAPEARASARFCWECGVVGRRFADLRGVRFRARFEDGRLVPDGRRRRWYFCWQCEQWSEGAPGCVQWDGGRVCAGVVGAPVRGRGRGDLKRQRRAAALERLPEAVFQHVLGLLGLREKIMLAQVCRGLQARVGPPGRGGDPLEKERFLKKQGRVLDLRQPRRLLACYACFRYRPRDQFSKQMGRLDLRDDGHRRRCWSCVGKLYGPGSATEDGRAALRQWQRQTLCTGCWCLRYADEACQACAEKAAELARKVAEGEAKRRWRQRRDKAGDDDRIVVNLLDDADPGVVDWFGNVGIAASNAVEVGGVDDNLAGFPEGVACGAEGSSAAPSAPWTPPPELDDTMAWALPHLQSNPNLLAGLVQLQEALAKLRGSA